jgi:hypothetical protein
VLLNGKTSRYPGKKTPATKAGIFCLENSRSALFNRH